jgi:hypothetical protein
MSMNSGLLATPFAGGMTNAVDDDCGFGRLIENDIGIWIQDEAPKPYPLSCNAYMRLIPQNGNCFVETVSYGPGALGRAFFNVVQNMK